MKKLSALALLLALSLSACGDNDDDKKSDDKQETTTQTTDSTETQTETDEETEASGDRPTAAELSAVLQANAEKAGMGDMPKSLSTCIGKGLYESDLSDDELQNMIEPSAPASSEFTKAVSDVTTACMSS